MIDEKALLGFLQHYNFLENEMMPFPGYFHFYDFMIQVF